MKRAIGFLVVIISSCINSSSTERDSGVYKAAYRHIMGSAALETYCRGFLQLDSSECVVAIPDSTVFMEYSLFTGRLVEAAAGEGRKAGRTPIVTVSAHAAGRRDPEA